MEERKEINVQWNSIPYSLLSDEADNSPQHFWNRRLNNVPGLFVCSANVSGENAVFWIGATNCLESGVRRFALEIIRGTRHCIDFENFKLGQRCVESESDDFARTVNRLAGNVVDRLSVLRHARIFVTDSVDSLSPHSDEEVRSFVVHRTIQEIIRKQKANTGFLATPPKVNSTSIRNCDVYHHGCSFDHIRNELYWIAE